MIKKLINIIPLIAFIISIIKLVDTNDTRMQIIYATCSIINYISIMNTKSE